MQYLFMKSNIQSLNYKTCDFDGQGTLIQG